MRKILGLDLGTNSIGWAVVNEAETNTEKSNIIKLGVRIINYDNFVSTETSKDSLDPIKDFRSGKSISCNAKRTSKRTSRHNLQRYKLRRNTLIDILKSSGWITDNSMDFYVLLNGCERKGKCIVGKDIFYFTMLFNTGKIIPSGSPRNALSSRPRRN